MATTSMSETRSEVAADPVEAVRQAERRLCADLGIEARERWLRLERPEMRARVLEIGEGPPTLHVHGGGAFGSLHAPLAAAMPGRRHLLVDRPGFGLSDRVAMHPGVRQRSIDFLVSVLDALELDRVDLVGNSLGAGMGLWLALAHPERVRSLAFVGGAAMLPGPPLPFLLKLLALPGLGPLAIRMDRPSPSQVRSVFSRFGQNPDTVTSAMHDVTLAMERVPAYAAAWAEILQATITWRGQRPGLVLTPEELRSIEHPVAFAWGSHDPMVAVEDGRAAAAQMKNAKLTVAGIGHIPWLDDAEAVARAIEPVLAPRA